MAKTPEGTVKDKVKKVLDRYKPDLFYEMPVVSMYGRRSIDFICCYDGRYFIIETKRRGERPTPDQDERIRNVQNAHGTALVIDDDTVHVLEMWLRGEEVVHYHPLPPKYLYVD